MCGRYILITNAEAIRLVFELPAFDARLAVARYNIAPTQPIVVVRRGPLGRELVPMRWGFIPYWAKDPKAPPLMINARAEGLADKPAFRNAFRRRRCLVPASGFYEWRAFGEGPKRPFVIRPSETEILAFAGLWETWCGADGSEIDTAAIVTVACDDRVRAVHDRMPAVIAPEDFQTWLSPDESTRQAEALLRPAPDELLTCRPVSTRVNSVANDDPALLETAPEPAGPAAPNAPTGEPAQPLLL